MTAARLRTSEQPPASRAAEEPRRAGARWSRETFRLAIALLGVATALFTATCMDAAWTSTYVVYFVLAFAFQFVWLGSRFPFALPYYTTMNAFAYIGGMPIVALEYAARLSSYPILLLLSRRGLMSLPPPLVPVLAPESFTSRAYLRAWIDHGTVGTVGAVSILLRVGFFTWMQSLHFGLIPSLAVGEFGTLAVLGVMSAVMPLPHADALRLGGRWRWRWRLDDDRVDLVVVVILVAPLFVFVINLAYAFEGLKGAAGFALATFGPHLLMKLSNDRLGRLSGLLESKQQELKNLVNTVAHDLKSPISAALLTTDLVLDRDAGALSAETTQDLTRIVRLLSRAEDMVRDLLRVFRIVWEPEQWDEIELDTVVERVLETVAPKATARGATIAVGALPTIVGQRSKLEHAFSNLLENAVRHLPESGGQVAVVADVEGDVATVSVRDNGCGIPADYLQRIFQLYSQVPRHGDGSGSGVGLSIVKRVAEAHGGSVWVESTIGAGSAFFLRLPRVLHHEAGARGPEPHASDPAEPAGDAAVRRPRSAPFASPPSAID